MIFVVLVLLVFLVVLVFLVLLVILVFLVILVLLVFLVILVLLQVLVGPVLSKGFARVSRQSSLEGKIKKNFKSESERAKLRAPCG